MIDQPRDYFDILADIEKSILKNSRFETRFLGLLVSYKLQWPRFICCILTMKKETFQVAF